MPRSSGVNVFGAAHTWTGNQIFNGGINVGGPALNTTAPLQDSSRFQLINIQAKAVTYVMAINDVGIFATAGAGGISITLPASPQGGTIAFVKRVDSGAGVVTVLPGTGTLDGAASVALPTLNQSIWCIFDGTNWQTIAADAAGIL